jgi:putative SOS response-associated peptidase YedK
MCGRYSLTTPTEALVALFAAGPLEGFSPRYNIAPTQLVPAVRMSEGERAWAWLRWGLIPSWAKDPAIGNRMINARAETVADKPAFRAALRRRRCLLPADGFYEWEKRDGAKQPYHIALADRAPFAFAGLWEHWQGDEAIESCTILTTAANRRLAPIHPRMPVILAPEHYDIWLDTEPGDARLVRSRRARSHAGSTTRATTTPPASSLEPLGLADGARRPWARPPERPPRSWKPEGFEFPTSSVPLPASAARA